MEHSEINKDIFYHVNEIPHECSTSYSNNIGGFTPGLNNTISNISYNNNNNNNLQIDGAILYDRPFDKYETKYNPVKYKKKVLPLTTYKIPISPIISDTYKLNNDLLDIHRNLIETKYMYNINKIYNETSTSSQILLGGGKNSSSSSTFVEHNTSSIFPSPIFNTESSFKLPLNSFESGSISTYNPKTITVSSEYSDSSDLSNSSNITTVSSEYSDSSDLSNSSNITTVTSE